jgi:hypothetical protein
MACGGSSSTPAPRPSIDAARNASATATAASTPQPTALVSLASRPTTIAGIEVGPSTTPTVPCTAGEAQEVPAGRAVGTRLEIAPGRLPARATLTLANAVECRGALIGAGNDYSLKPDPAGARRGGSLTIARLVQSSRALPTGMPLDRVREVTVAGRRGVLVPPEVPGGDGLASLAIAEEWGVTTLVSTGLTEAQLLALAESLY